MKNELDIHCPGVILAIEFLPDRNAICVSLSDRSFLFYDSGAQNYKIVRKIHVPSTQKCLCYVKRKKALFSAGTDGTIYAWNIEKIFSNEFVEDEIQREKEKNEFDYTLYIAEKTPWFVGDTIMCVIDLPNINFLATGSYDKLIRLWDLRGSTEHNFKTHDDKTSFKESTMELSASLKKSVVPQFDLKKKSGPESKKTLSSVGKKTKGSERHDDLFDDIVK